MGISEGPLTSLALCWRIERGDGAGVALTSHDRSIVSGGRHCVAEPGMTPAAITRSLGLEPHSGEVAGALRSSALSDTDLALGRWDGARVRLTAVERSVHARDRQAVEDRLFGMLTTEPSYTIRAKCVDSLVRRGSELALDACLEAIGQDSDRHEVRDSGLSGLRRLGGAEHAELGRPYCTAGNSRWYRHNALETFAALAAKLEDAIAKKHFAHALARDRENR